MTKKKWKPHAHSDEAVVVPPKYWPGDPVVLDDGSSARVEFSRSDGMCCLTLPSGKREWLHEDTIQFAPGFTPERRPRR